MAATSRAPRVMIALALAGALSACGVQEAPETDTGLARAADTELGARIAGEAPPEVGGQTLHAAVLRHFYARHGFAPVWAGRPAQARSLVAAVLRAGAQGLDPALFHGDLLRHDSGLAPLDRDLLLSDAFLAYADALARGAVPVERRGEDQVLTPEPVDVADTLDAAMDRTDAGAAIEALAPNTPTYLTLRHALRTDRAGGRVLGTDQRRAIAVALERQRWLPRHLPADRAWVNVAAQQLILFHAGRPVFWTRVVVGEDVKGHQTPEFRATIDASFFDPPWVIPADIVAAEIQPKIDLDPNYLTKNHMVMLDGGEAEQLPGPDAGLGLIMFDMPNKFDVFLHDTPDRYIFKRDNRRLSHGCVRVQNPRAFAALLLREPVAQVDAGVAGTTTTRHDLPAPVPVFVVYQTVFLDGAGVLQFRPDFYGRDTEIWEKLRGQPAGAV